ncbi:hypothetical protein GCM10022204_26630 [Microlunatus aurantiacus]|uniref:Pentapeptide repeat-containing protein n=2 Tax=Microlunatus aurantiacus TaxID=446786 RepID=A0ABP7DLL5_9ACTN
MFGLTLTSCASANEVTGTSAELADHKLKEEIRKLKFETDRASSPLGVVIAVGPFVTVIIAALTFGLAVFKQASDRDKDRLARVDQQDKDRESREDQQAKDRQARFDAQFTTAAAQVAATEEGLQVAGAASLLRLQDSADDQMQKEIVLYCATQLRIGTTPKVGPIIKEVLAAALRRLITDPGDPQRLKALNLEGANLSGIDLSGVDLRNVRINLTRADLSDANLSRADLRRTRAPRTVFVGATCENTNFGPAKLGGADFRRARLGGARMASANLQGCDLSGASLRGAELQSTHFERAILNPTDFAHANVNDAYFSGAIMAAATLESLKTVKNRDKAHGLPPLGGATP